MRYFNMIPGVSVICFLLLESAPCQTIGQMMSSVAAESRLTDNDKPDLFSSNDVRAGTGALKSKWKALGLSLIVPGAGQFYAGSKNKMAIFGSAEALVWSGFFGFRIYGGWKKEDYRGWAALKAGAYVEGKSEDYFEKMTYYDNLNEYNQFELLYEGSRALLFPSTREFYWNWDSDASRRHFRDLRNQSKTAYRRSILVLGAAVANRILAGIDAYRTASSLNKQSEFSDSGWNLYCSTANLPEDGEVEIGFTRNF